MVNNDEYSTAPNYAIYGWDGAFDVAHEVTISTKMVKNRDSRVMKNSCEWGSYNYYWMIHMYNLRGCADV